MPRRATVLFVVPTLGLGGVERALSSVLERIDRTRFAPSLCVLGGDTDDVPVPADVTVVKLGRESRWSFLRVVGRLRRVIKRTRPDAIVAFSGTANMTVLVAARLVAHRPKLIVTEHISPLLMYTSDEEPFGWLKQSLVRHLYPLGDAVVAVSNGVAGELEQVYGIADELLSVAHTPVELATMAALAQEQPRVWPATGPVVVAVGRLTTQKNHALLLRALALVQAQRPIAAVIVGDGPERLALEGLARTLELRAVSFAGSDPNPYPYIARADVFALSSDFEGFGVVLVEALALGTPIVSSDCASGPREILDSGEFGLLVAPGDAEALSRAIIRILDDDELRERFRRLGPARARLFSSESATKDLEQTIAGVLDKAV